MTLITVKVASLETNACLNILNVMLACPIQAEASALTISN